MRQPRPGLTITAVKFMLPTPIAGQTMQANINSVDDQSRPALARGVRIINDPITASPVLLFPEGVMDLDETTLDILRRCSGQSTVASIVESLVEEYDIDRATARADVCECLDQLRQRMLVAFVA